MTVQDFLNSACERIQRGWVIAALTDEYIVDKWPLTKDILDGKDDKILEMRVFCNKGEMRLSRTDLGKDFSNRSIFDDKDNRDHFDEVQFLDIDEKVGKTGDGRVFSTGGGSYNLPVERITDAKIKIRYYLGKYTKTGQAMVEDWRAVEFMEGK